MSDFSLILFEAGDVLVHNPGTLLWDRVLEKLRREYSLTKAQEKNYKAYVYAQTPQSLPGISELTTPTNNGSMSDQQFIDRFFATIEVPQPPREKALELFLHPNIYQPIHTMNSILQQLSSHDIRIGVLSDCSSFVIHAVKHQLVFHYGKWIPEENMLFSAHIKAAKSDEPTQAFVKAMQHFAMSDPNKILFVDDREEYLIKAEKQGIRTFHFTSRTSAEQLRTWLKL